MNGVDWLLDTNVVIGLLKGHVEAVALAENQGLMLNRSAVSQITRMELLGFPGLTETEEARIQAFLNDCRVVLLDEAIEQQSIRLRRSGLFKLPDAIIAATALIWNKPLDLEQQASLEEDFSESDLPFKVDVVDWATTAEGFRGIIERGQVVVQVKEEKERSVERLPVTWRFLSIDEIKSDEDGAIAIGPFGSRMKADLYTAYGVPVIR